MELYLSTHCQFTMICIYLCSDDVVVDVVCEHRTRAENGTVSLYSLSVYDDLRLPVFG